MNKYPNLVVDKGTHGNSQTTQDMAKAIGCSPETDKKAIAELNIAIPAQLSAHGDVKPT